MLSTIPARKKITIQTSALKSKKTSGGLGNLHVDDWENQRKRIGISILHLVFTFKDQIEALLNSRSEVNAISQAFAHQLGLKIRKTNVEAQKIDGIILETYGIIVSTFSVLDKDGRERLFEKSFLLADIKPDIVLRMSFLTISNADVDFQAQALQWKSYTTGDVSPTTRRVELIEKKEFAATTLDLEHEAFVVHVAAFSVDLGDGVHPSKKT